jgi:hypothetical protein
VAEGTYTVHVSHHWNNGGEATCPLLNLENVSIPNGITKLDLACTRGKVVQGCAHDKAGKPVIMGTYSLTRDDGTDFVFLSTDAKGWFRVEGVPPGTYWLALEDCGWEGSAEGCVHRRFEVPETSELVQLDLETIPYGTLKGRVLGPGGRPLYKARLRISSKEIHFEQTVVTDFYGRFNIEQSVIPGSYEVEVDGDLAYQTRKLNVLKLALDKTSFTVAPDQDLELELVAHE